jgi:galactose mutarotase-like enzyme
MRLASSDGTLAVFPWAFRFDLTVRLVGASLELALAIANTGAETMPFGVGFHPYFRLDDGRKASAVVPTDAKRAFDNARKGMVSLSRIDLAREEVDLHLEGHGGGALELHDGPRHLVVRGSDAFTQWVVWTLAGRDFVCLEPWSCPGDAMNTGDRLGHLAPGATTTSSVVIDCVA